MGSEPDPRDDRTTESSNLTPITESSSTPATTSQSRDNRPRKKTSTACSVCKKRKTRCSGEYPCDRCIQRGTVADCVIDSNADLRRRGASERRAEELENDRRLLDGILETIRTSPEEQVQSLCGMIRAGAPRSDLLSHVDGLLQGSVASDGSMLDGSQPSSPREERRQSQSTQHQHRPRPSIHNLLNHEPGNTPK